MTSTGKNLEACESADERWAVLDALKRDQGCKDCGTQDGDLDFDHRDDEIKHFNVAQYLTAASERLAAERGKQRRRYPVASLSREQKAQKVAEGRHLRKLGRSYSEIASQLAVSIGTAHRFVNHDYKELRGIPIKADDDLPTGRFKLICSGQHGDDAPVDAVAERREVAA